MKGSAAKQPIVLVGGGGHCRSCIDLVEQHGSYRVAGIVDKAEKIGEQILGCRVFAEDDDIAQLTSEYRFFLITIGQIRSAALRKKTFALVRQHGGTLPVICSPLAHVSPHARIGMGTVIMPYALVGPGAVVGENCIINTRALVEHDTVIGDHCHLATGAIVNGGCRIGDEVFIGSGSVVREQIRIAAKTVVGCGARIIKDITASGETVY